MNRILLALAATAALAACDKRDHTIVAGSGGANAAPVNTVGVVLPPAITASKTYRCKDNSLVYIDWIADGTARVKADKNEVGTSVMLGEEGAPLSGSAADASVTYNGQSCKA